MTLPSLTSSLTILRMILTKIAAMTKSLADLSFNLVSKIHMKRRFRPLRCIRLFKASILLILSLVSRIFATWSNESWNIVSIPFA